MPLMLVAVLGLFYLRLQPVVNSFKTYSNPKVVTLPGSPQDAIDQPAPERLTTPAFLKVEADAHVSASSGFLNGKSYSHPIEVRIDFTGGMASEAYRYGQVKITSATSDTGEPLEILSIGSGLRSDAQSGFVLIDRSAKDFFTKQPEHPQDGFRLKVQFFKPEKELTQVGSLVGMVTLQTIDPARTVRVENIGSNLSGPGKVQLKDPKLDAIGKFWLMVHESDPETLHLIVEGKQLDGVNARIVDAHETLVPEGISTTTFGEDSTKDFTFSVKNNSLTNARLEIILAYQSIEAPFDVKNIIIQK